MGLLDFVRLLLGGDDQRTPPPSMAEITIISTEAVTPSSESPSPQAQG